MLDLGGVIVPLITPFRADGTLDTRGVSRLVDRLLKCGVDGLFVAGTTGEFLALPAQMRTEAVKCVAAAASNQVPVVAGIGANCLEDVLRYGEEAERAGAHYVAVVLPSFFPLSDEDAHGFLTQVVERTPLPLVLYDHPSFAGNQISLEVVGSFSSDKRVVGIKDSSGDLARFKDLIRLFQSPEFKVYLGDELLMAQGLREGADGVVPSLGNIHPNLFVLLYRAAREGDWKSAEKVQEEITCIVKPLRDEGNWVAMIRSLKRQLKEEGICQDYMSSLFAGSQEKVFLKSGVGGKGGD